MNCVNRTQELKGFCLIHDQDNFNIETSATREVTTAKHIERKLNSCCMHGVVKNLQNVAPTKSRLDAEEAEIVPPILKITLRRWPEADL